MLTKKKNKSEIKIKAKYHSQFTSNFESEVILKMQKLKQALCMLWSIFNFVVLVEVQQIWNQTGKVGRLYTTSDQDKFWNWIHHASDCPRPFEKLPVGNSNIENRNLERVIVDFVEVWGTDQNKLFKPPGNVRTSFTTLSDI